VPRWRVVWLAERRHVVALLYLLGAGSASPGDLRPVLGGAARRTLRDLEEHGLARRRGGVYELTPRGRRVARRLYELARRLEREEGGGRLGR